MNLSLDTVKRRLRFIFALYKPLRPPAGLPSVVHTRKNANGIRGYLLDAASDVELRRDVLLAQTAVIVIGGGAGDPDAFNVGMRRNETLAYGRFELPRL
jgi:hypothetical protein